jgi:deoxyribonucleoside regulator
MAFKYDVELMVNVARLYYQEGLKQDEIAKQVKVSRSSISLILTEARENGIVEIKIRNPISNNHELSQKFEQEFGLRNCYIVPTTVMDQEILLQLVIMKAVEIFKEIVKSGDLIGMAWGQTCYQFMNEYTAEELFEGLNVLPLIGGSLFNQTRYQMNEVVRQFADKVNGQPSFIHAPAFPHLKEDYDLYMSSSEMKEVMEMWKKVEIAIISFGTAPIDNSNSIAGQMSMSPEDKAELKRDAVGDICARFYDIKGNFIENTIDQRTIGISPEILKDVISCIAIVTGQQKLSSIIGGLRTGVVDILVIDEPTAKGVLDLLR